MSKRKLVSLEEALKSTPAQFKEWLRRNGKQTFRSDGHRAKDGCPVVTYLKARTGDDKLQCGYDVVYYGNGIDAKPLPRWMRSFIACNGSQGQYAGKTYAEVLAYSTCPGYFSEWLTLTPKETV